MNFIYIGLVVLLFCLAMEYRHHIAAYGCLAIMLLAYIVIYLPGAAWRRIRDGY